MFLVGSLLSLAATTAGLYVNPRFRPRFERRRSLRTFGRGRTVDHRVVYPDAAESGSCIECGERFDEGMITRYREEQYVFGLPVRTLSDGHNTYCRDCALREQTEGTTGTLPADSRHTDPARADGSGPASSNPAQPDLERE